MGDSSSKWPLRLPLWQREARIEIVGERRRVHDAAFRVRVVEEALVLGARMRDLARRHGLCTSLIYRGRRDAMPRAPVAAALRPDAAAPASPGQAMAACSPLEFVPIGVLGRSGDGGPALVAGSPTAVRAPSSSGHAPLPRPAMEDRPGVIEIDLVDGTRLRVDAFAGGRVAAGAGGIAGDVVIAVAPGTKVYLACRPVSMRYGFDGLAALVTRVLEADPFSGHLFCSAARGPIT